MILNWCASNLIARRDDNMNMAPDKKRSADKIDDLAALLMAIGVSGADVQSQDLSTFSQTRSSLDKRTMDNGLILF